jgi:hypothetical protein
VNGIPVFQQGSQFDFQRRFEQIEEGLGQIQSGQQEITDRAIDAARERARAREEGIAKEEEILKEAKDDRKGRGIQFGVGMVTDLIGGYFVNRAYEKEKAKQQRRFSRQIEPIVSQGAGVTDKLGGAIDFAMNQDPYGTIPEQTLQTGRASTTAAKSKAGLTPAGEGILGAAAENYLRGEVAAATLKADASRAQRAAGLLEAQAGKTSIAARERGSAISTAAHTWNTTYMLAEKRAQEVASTVDAISSLANAAMMVYSLGGFDWIGGLGDTTPAEFAKKLGGTQIGPNTFAM